MPRTIIQGEPGEAYRNTTGKVLFQFVAELRNTCGQCLQYHHAVGSWWPIPLHPRCRCQQRPVPPDAVALPFVDFREVLDSLPPHQQTAVIGRAALTLVERGVVEWSDVVSATRVRTLREVVSSKKLSIAAMIKAGVPEAVATRAYAATNTLAHAVAEEHREKAVERLEAAGISRKQAVRAAAERVAARATIGSGPSGPQGTPIRPAPPKLGPTKAEIEEGLGVRFVPSPGAKAGRYATVVVDVVKVDEALAKDRGFHVGPGGTGAAIEGRYEGSREFLARAKAEGISVEMPRLAISDATGEVSISDGRHRFAVFRDAGVRYLPVSVARRDAKTLRRLYGPTPAPAPGQLHAAPKGKPKATAKEVAPVVAETLGVKPEAILSAQERVRLALEAREKARATAGAAALKEKLANYAEGDRKVAEIAARGEPVLRAREAWEKAREHADELARMRRAETDPARRTEIEAALARAQDAYRVAYEAKEKAESRLRGSLAGILKPDGPRLGLDVREGSLDRLSEHPRRAAENAVNWLSRVVAAGPEGESAGFGFRPKSGERPHYDTGTGNVHMTGVTTVAGAIHELGHMLEQKVSGWNDAAQAFLRLRVGDESPARLDGLFPQNDFRPDEVGRKDRFDAAFSELEAYYCGKDYGSQASEVTAMGVEKLFNDPAGFATRDPEYCKFIVGLLSGHLR